MLGVVISTLALIMLIILLLLLLLDVVINISTVHLWWRLALLLFTLLPTLYTASGTPPLSFSPELKNK